MNEKLCLITQDGLLLSDDSDLLTRNILYFQKTFNLVGHRLFNQKKRSKYYKTGCFRR